MKKMVLFLAVIGMMSVLGAAEAKLLRIALGSLLTEEVAFKINSISVSTPEIARVEIISENGHQIRISGQKVGMTDIQILGGGMSQVYKVTVYDDLRDKLQALRRDLDAVPEVSVTMNNGRLVLKGELSNIANQELKNKVVKAYGTIILDLTTFRPTPEVMVGLHKNFEKAGFKVVRNAGNAAPGVISITQVGEMLTISGSVYGPEDLKKINSILSAQPWLTVNANNSAKADGKVQAYVNVQVVPVMLQIDIIHLALNRTEAESIGIDWSSFVNGGFGLGSQLLWSVNKVMGKSTDQNGQAAFGVGSNGALSAWLAFFGSNGITRARRAGFLTFKSNDTPQFRKLHNGGTLYISSDAVSGSTSQLKDIEYGLILEVKGGLTGADTVAIEINQELSYPGPVSSNVRDAKLDLKKFKTSSSFVAKLDEPIALGGLKEWTQKNTASESIPYLRNVPVLKWLISNDSDTFTEEEILTIVCVRKMAKSGAFDSVAAELQKMKKSEDEFIKNREKEKSKNSGKWYEFWKW
ncbi:MAG: pilus assembly protein N-terminal domain-containing protein [Lentisphaeria bacterium]|nr:pilus assembly protein N-terminal domain-containing protein [Lentisphaeria bacterium]